MVKTLKTGISSVLTLSIISMSFGYYSMVRAEGRGLVQSVRIQREMLQSQLDAETKEAAIYAARIKMIEGYSSEKGLPLYVTHRDASAIAAGLLSNAAVAALLAKKGLLKSFLKAMFETSFAGGIVLAFLMAIVGAPAGVLVGSLAGDHTYYKKISAMNSEDLSKEYDNQVSQSLTKTGSMAALKLQIEALEEKK